jgi:two-component system, NarL family, nitrate/nitrite response regulator NarL
MRTVPMTNDSIVLIDRSRLFREGLRRIFLNSSFTVIHEASSIEDAMPFIEFWRPALVLLDLPIQGTRFSSGPLLYLSAFSARHLG